MQKIKAFRKGDGSRSLNCCYYSIFSILFAANLVFPTAELVIETTNGPYNIFWLSVAWAVLSMVTVGLLSYALIVMKRIVRGLVLEKAN